MGIVVGCAVVVFAILSLGFPATVAGWSEQLGNYGVAAKYAALYYSYTGETEDLARCADDAILSGKDSYIIEYCEELVACDDFSDYCEQYDAAIEGAYPGLGYSYRQFVYGRLAQAYYSSDDLQSALGVAVEALVSDISREQFLSGESFEISSFPVSNALGTLALSVIESQDGAAAASVLNIFDCVDNDSLTPSQLNYFNTLKTNLEAIA